MEALSSRHPEAEGSAVEGFRSAETSAANRRRCAPFSGCATRSYADGVRTAREIRFANPARAVRELGLPQTPIREALAKAVQWFQAKPAAAHLVGERAR